MRSCASLRRRFASLSRNACSVALSRVTSSARSKNSTSPDCRKFPDRRKFNETMRTRAVARMPPLLR